MSAVPSSSRGVWIAPWKGARGELVVFAMTRAGTLAGDLVTIPVGADRVAIADELWILLDQVDPIRSPITTRSPCSQRVAVSARRRLKLNLVK